MKNNWLFTLILLLTCKFLSAQLSVSKIFSDHAVLQRGIDLPIWGTAKPLETITIRFEQQEIQVRADKQGKWEGKLSKLAAGGPYTLSIASELNSISYTDILIGDVWLCSGQSNMEWTVNNSKNAQAEIANATDSQIRHFKVPRSYSLLPQDSLAGGSWEVGSPETVAQFTAVGYFFARELRKHQQVPIGLLNTSWGGSRIEPWMRAQTLGYENAMESADKIQAYMDSIEQQSRGKLEQLLGDLPDKDRGMKDGFPFWASADYNHEGWKSMELPGLWESKGYPGLDGVVWYRKEIYLTREEAMQEVQIHLGAIDDADVTYINGEKIGSTNAYDQNRRYTIGANQLREGLNILCVQVTDTGWGGGFSSGCDALYYESAKGQKSLCGDWFFNVGKVDLNNVVMQNQFHTLLYHFMIHPILRYPIKGTIWYQGESNAGMADAKLYQEQFSTMIKDWRAQWNCGDFPFLWVQLANWRKVAEKPSDTGWARLREAQNKTLALPNTAQAVIIDIGEADDIHPRNKQDVGWRLALGARKIAYGESLVHAGPTYQAMRVEGNKIILDFETYGSTLMARKGQALKEFAIAGADRKFYWAKATIQGKEIVVSSEQVPEPLAVRYAWANNPDQANLYNAEGLPASPFRTDDWEN